MEGPGTAVDVNPGRVVLFTTWSLPGMAAIVATVSGVARLTRWLGSANVPGASARSMIER